MHRSQNTEVVVTYASVSCCVLVAAESVFSVMCACANGMRNVLRVASAQTLESGCCQPHEDTAYIKLLHVGCDYPYVSGELCRERNVSSAFLCAVFVLVLCVLWFQLVLCR